MSDSTSKTEYIVTYHYKSGGTYTEIHGNYGTAIYAASTGGILGAPEVVDWYEVKEISTTERLLKSTKYHI